jgi:CRISPR/Cas system-associated exonuclease Cas4 (RecB family)
MDSKQFIKADKVKAIAWLASLIDSLDDGKEYTIEVKERRKKRSSDANAMAWALITELAAVMNEKKTDVYKRYIAECGGTCEVVC